MYSIEYNEESCLIYHVIPVRRPDVPAAEEKIEEIEVPGRDGILISREKVYKQIVIPVEFNFMAEPDKWAENYRKAKKWLTGSGKLVLSDDAECFYKVYFCKITSSERTSRKIGTFTAEFTCAPYVYFKSGEREKSIEEVLYNPYLLCKPIYKITGEGICLLNVNGKEFKANVGQNLTIDTELMIAYREDGEPMNTKVSGDYEDLYLKPGNNDIEITDGFELKIIPNWRSL